MAESARGGPDSRFNENLIKEVKKHPVVYDTTHPFYSNGAQKQLAWTEIANLLNEKGMSLFYAKICCNSHNVDIYAPSEFE